MQTAEIAIARRVFHAAGVHRNLAPLAAHPRETLGAEAGFFAPVALARVLGQIALAPMVLLDDIRKRLIGHIGGALATIANAELLTFEMNTVLADAAPDCAGIVLDSFAANVAEFSLRMRINPAMGHRVLDGTAGHCRAARNDRLDAALVDNKIAHLANVSLADEAPEHVGAMVTISGFVECFLGEIVAVALDE